MAAKFTYRVQRNYTNGDRPWSVVHLFHGAVSRHKTEALAQARADQLNADNAASKAAIRSDPRNVTLRLEASDVQKLISGLECMALHWPTTGNLDPLRDTLREALANAAVINPKPSN